MTKTKFPKTCKLCFIVKGSEEFYKVTGKVRALLCKKCNMGIGLLGEDPIVLTNVIAYLQKFSGNK